MEVFLRKVFGFFLYSIGFMMSPRWLTAQELAVHLNFLESFGEVTDAIDKGVQLSVAYHYPELESWLDTNLLPANYSFESFGVQLITSIDYFDFSSPLAGRDAHLTQLGFNLLKRFKTSRLEYQLQLTYGLGYLVTEFPAGSSGRLAQNFAAKLAMEKAWDEKNRVQLGLGLGHVFDKDYPLNYYSVGVAYVRSL